MCNIFFKKFTDEATIAVLIMFTLHICFATYQKLLILLCKVIKPGDWDKMVTAQVTYFIFHISLFPSGVRVTEPDTEVVMGTKREKVLFRESHHRSCVQHQ